MNLLPVPLETVYDLGRTRDATSEVAPARKAKRPVDPVENAGRDQATQVLDVLQRETLANEYASLNQQAKARSTGQYSDPQVGHRAVAAYESVALQDKRDVLSEMLGVSEYA